MVADVFPDFPRDKVIANSPFPEIITNMLDAEQREEQLVLLEQYIQEFDSWLEASTGPQQDKALLEGALFSHEQVIELAKYWLSLGTKELASFRQKSKVIMAYADNLPKRLSRYRPLKG